MPRGVDMEKWKKRSIELLTSLAFGGEGGLSVIPYYPQKTETGREEERFFRRSLPEKQGVSSARLYNMLCELEGERRANIHSLMVLRNGEVICECSVRGYSVNTWHISHSMSKTVCGMVIGILIERGIIKLDEKLTEIFPEIPYRDKKFALITVEHLLTMTSGVDFGEMGSVTEQKWTEAFFDAAVRFVPGTKFAYNSMNSYILARIAERVTGESFGKLVNGLIFAPMGIKSYFWEKGPEGTEKGGWGLYLSPESWLKLGYMFSSGGVFMGRRILPSKWVRECSVAKAEAPEWSGSFNYSYHTWVSKNGQEVLFNGLFGQNLWINLENGIIVALSCGNNELFQDSPALEIIRKYLGGRITDELSGRCLRQLYEKTESFFHSRAWVRPKERERRFLYRLVPKFRYRFDEKWTNVLGNYLFGPNDAGILPLIVRVMQNNLDSCLNAIQLDREGDNLVLSFAEGYGCHSLEIGFYEYKTTILDFNGEKYVVKAMGEAFIGEMGETEYRIELLFPELSSVRRLRIIKKCEDYIELELTETPDGEIAARMIGRMSEFNRAAAFGIEILERRLGEGAVAENVKGAFKPRLVGANSAIRGYERILEEEGRRLSEQQKNTRLVRAIVDKFFKENCESEVKESANQRPKTIKEFLLEISKSFSIKNE